ncbi:MAG: Ig-like domain-containing protein [Lachnospiraceae bacterium]|nr:Ig-like domain-containing protein [Lachnospiraceae bacterium]
MRKNIIRFLLAALAAMILFIPTRAYAGEVFGTLSKNDPSIYKVFTMKDGEEHYLLFDVKGNPTGCQFHLENMTVGNTSAKAVLHCYGSFDNIKESIKLDPGYLGATIGTTLEDSAGNYYVIEIKDVDCAGGKDIQLGVCVWSEDWGGTQYDFVKYDSSSDINSGSDKKDDKVVEEAGIKLSKDTLNIKKGKKSTLKAVLTGDLKGSKVTWTSSNPKVAKVSKKGKITAKKYGTAIITCTSKKDPYIIATCTVNVVKKVPKTDTSAETAKDDKTGQDSKTEVSTSGNISSVSLSEGQGSNMMMSYSYSSGFLTGATRLLTLKSNDYSGTVTLLFTTSDGCDECKMVVEKNSTYYINYRYSVHKNPDTVIKQPDQQIMIGTDPITGMPKYTTLPGQTTTIPAPVSSINLYVSIEDGAYLSHTESFAGTFNKGSFSFSKVE